MNLPIRSFHFLVFAISANQLFAQEIRRAIPVTPEVIQAKPATWSQADEDEFSRWVQAIGESKCSNPSKCINSPANYLRSAEDAQIAGRLHVDCGRLPYFFRGYFAVKKGLPFTSTSDVEANGSGSDIRYTPKGNSVTSRKWITNETPNKWDA